MDRQKQFRFLRGKSGQRGVALLLAILIVALLSLAVTEFLYRSRVDLDTAINYRDMEQARYAARAGVEAATLFITALNPNEWADALLSLGIPNFGTGGFIKGEENISKAKPQEELEGKVFNEESNLTGVSFTSDYSDMARADPDGFNNGYLWFISSQTGFDFFEDENIDVHIRFIDESSRFNLNALYYCPGNVCGPDASNYNKVLFFEIRQLFIEELIRKPEEEKLRDRKPGRRSKKGGEDEEEAGRERAGGESLSGREDKPLDEGDIDNILCAILDWLDPDEIPASNENCREGAENSDYAMLDEPYEPRNGPMESVGELRLVQGMTPEIYRAVAPYLTVYPQVTSSDCTSRLTTLSGQAVEDEKLFCFDDKVNLHAASDAVILAWAVGGFNPAQNTEPSSGRDLLELKEEVLTLLNCSRIPENKRDDLGCPPPPATTAAQTTAGDCWPSNASVKNILQESGIYTIREIGETQNVGTASVKGLDCTASGQQQAPGQLGQPQQSFRRLVGDYITVEAIGRVGMAEEEEGLEEEAPEELEEEGEEIENPERGPIEAKITATYRIDASASPVKLELLRWSEE